MHDVIIIGSAAAGLTAGLYAARRNMKTLIIGKSLGGQAVAAHSIENYPGFSCVSGLKLMQKFEEQAVAAGAEIIYQEVKEIDAKKNTFVVSTKDKKFEGKTLILALGKTPRSLDATGEKEFTGKGVSYCATCDMPIFKDKTVAVIGGGNSALDAALYGSEIAKKVYLIHRREEFRGFEYLVDRLKKKKNVEFVLNSTVTEFKGNNFLKSMTIQNLKKHENKVINVDGCFIEIGYEVDEKLIKDIVKLDKNKQVIINSSCETYHPHSDEIMPGVFAAGDVTNTPFKQIIISGGEGSKAALQAYNYLHGIKERVFADWAVLKKEGD